MNTIKKMNRTCKLALIISFILIAILAVQILPAVFNESNAEAGNRYVPWDSKLHKYTPDKHQRAALRIDQNFWDQAYKALAECHNSGKGYYQHYFVPEISFENDTKTYYPKVTATKNGKRDNYIYTDDNTDTSGNYLTDISPLAVVYKNDDYDNDDHIYFGWDFKFSVGHGWVDPYLDNTYRMTLFFYADDDTWWAITRDMDSICVGTGEGYYRHHNDIARPTARVGWHDTWVKGPDGIEKHKDDKSGKGVVPAFNSKDGKTLTCSDADYASFIGKTGWLFIRYVFEED